MTRCDALAQPNFAGLGALATVGGWWMSDCASLATPSFAGLGALAAVGAHWMANCPAFVAVDSDPAGHAARRVAAMRP
jgi:hypothetical protein